MEPHEHYTALVESSDDAIVAKDLDGIIVSWNPASERIFGYSADEIIGKSIQILLPPERLDEEREIMARIRAGERVRQFMSERLHKDGTVVPVSLTVSPVRNAKGEIIGASKIARDATEYIARDKRLRESEQRFRMLAENISQLAWISDSEGNLSWYNRRWYDYTGTTLEEMKGLGWTKVHHPDHVDRVVKHFRDSLTKGEVWEDTFPLRSRHGDFRWYLSRAKPIRNAEGEIIQWFGTNTDITEQREQAEQIRLLLMEVNHRSKNMLTTVQALARRTARSSENFIERFEERVSSLAVNQDILVRRAWRDVPVDELVHLQLRFLEEAPGELTFDGPQCALTPRAAEVIGMALHELATNSLKYGALSSDEGQVHISWEHDTAGQGDFLIVWTESGGPPVEPPTRTGFGSKLIEDVPRHNLSAEVELDYARDGLKWSLRGSNSLIARHSSDDSAPLPL
ncbi:PAS domain S-box protein [Altericroceibacterium endophyticum]|uniref:histidine kinase n=1 Tax=Altericroceibacterium endophyticum TaxID=1808508 RepID=A0A6I4T8D9_9SPHN|nr:PAS domain S-box protein [Altericroceibacterium endophyticum]MXO66130.1 PAS domain S-box protein [Altericroceibacterium endophyticum]